MVWKVFEGKCLSPEISNLEDDNMRAGTGSLPTQSRGPVLLFETSVRRLIFPQGRQEPKGTQGPGYRAALATGARVPPILTGLNKHRQAPEEKGREEGKYESMSKSGVVFSNVALGLKSCNRGFSR